MHKRHTLRLRFPRDHAGVPKRGGVKLVELEANEQVFELLHGFHSTPTRVVPVYHVRHRERVRPWVSDGTGIRPLQVVADRSNRELDQSSGRPSVRLKSDRHTLSLPLKSTPPRPPKVGEAIGRSASTMRFLAKLPVTHSRRATAYIQTTVSTTRVTVSLEPQHITARQRAPSFL